MTFVLGDRVGSPRTSAKASTGVVDARVATSPPRRVFIAASCSPKVAKSFLMDARSAWVTGGSCRVPELDSAGPGTGTALVAKVEEAVVASGLSAARSALCLSLGPISTID